MKGVKFIIIQAWSQISKWHIRDGEIGFETCLNGESSDGALTSDPFFLFLVAVVLLPPPLPRGLAEVTNREGLDSDPGGETNAMAVVVIGWAGSGSRRRRRSTEAPDIQARRTITKAGDAREGDVNVLLHLVGRQPDGIS